jgi:hypothetical protein
MVTTFITANSSNLLFINRIAAIVSLIAINSLSSGCSQEQPNYQSILNELELSEVAATFDEDKTNRFAQKEPGALDFEERRAAAVLASLGLKGSRSEILKQWDAHPIMQTLGNSKDPDWLTKEKETIQTFADLLSTPLEEKISTGYNIMPQRKWPDFDPAKTIIYGHNDFKHARQLYALLHSEGMRPKVTLLHKSSAFLYKDDWGEPTMPLVLLKNGDRLVVTTEYDLCIEFQEEQDIDRFAELVTRYAKKDTPDEQGLIYDSWWQPFYRTFQPSSFGTPLTVMLIQYKGYRANLISIPKLAADKLSRLRKMNADWTAEPITIWVNPAFYRFQLGDHR